jgi:hypothetical protein
MSKSRRKSGGCTRGRYKPKKMGKGWCSDRRQRGHEKPVVRKKEDAKES